MNWDKVKKPGYILPISIGSKAYEMLTKGSERAAVHSVFRNAINLQYEDDYLITAMPESFSASCQSVILSEADFNTLKSSITVFDGAQYTNSPMLLQKTRIIDLSIPDFEKFPAFKKLPVEVLKEAVKSYKEAFGSKSIASGLAPILGGSGNLYTEAADRGLQELKESLCSERLEGIKAALFGFIGLGPGLTPSGDDFIYGCLAALYYFWAYKDKDRSILEKTAAEIAVMANKKTTIISYNMLRSCIAGEFNESVRDFCISLLNSKYSEAFMEKVLRIGSSSGADIMTGMLFTFESLLDKEVKNEIKMPN